jgi:SnoaL-like protein
MKPKTESGLEAAPRTVERRSFIWKAGAALTGTVASAAAIGAGSTPAVARATGDSQEIDRLSNELGLREDADAIREAHRAFGTALNERRYEDLVRLFADDARVHLNGEVFAGKERGIRRLYVERFSRHGEEPKPEPVHACLVDSAHDASIEVSADRQSATARFPCLTQVECAIERGSSLVEMARQQGQGVRQWWEHGLYESSYVKRGGEWQILELRYSANGRADLTRPAVPG